MQRNNVNSNSFRTQLKTDDILCNKNSMMQSMSELQSEPGDVYIP